MLVTLNPLLRVRKDGYNYYKQQSPLKRSICNMQGSVFNMNSFVCLISFCEVFYYLSACGVYYVTCATSWVFVKLT